MPTYPLSFPTDLGPISDTFKPVSQGVSHRGIYTGITSVQSTDGSYWERQLTFTPMLRDNAEKLLSFLLRLQGQVGTFKCGVFGGRSSRGRPTGVVNLASFSTFDSTMTITDAKANNSKFLIAGDWFEINGSLFKCLEDVRTNSLGGATFEVFPRPVSLRCSAGQVLIFNNPQGEWRLAATPEWTVDQLRRVGISIAMPEAIL